MYWYLEALKKYAVFSGRARRSEYWMFCLLSFIISMVLVVFETVGLDSDRSLFGSIYNLAILIPTIAVSVRRLHDTDRSGWWLLIAFVPLIGLIVLLLEMVQDSFPSGNQYGANPKEAADASRRAASTPMIAGLILITIVLAVVVSTRPAVERARQAAHRTQSRNNLKQIGLALHKYHNDHQGFPTGTHPNDKLEAGERLSWLASILRYTNQSDLHQKINFDAAWNDEPNEQSANTRVPTYVNPGASTSMVSPGETHYVGIAGLGKDGPTLPVTSNRAGVFAVNRQTRIRDITDGTSNTMMTSEASDKFGPWISGGNATIRPLTEKPYINGPDGIGGPFRGVVVGFADGSVKFFSEDVDPTVLELVSTIAGDRVFTGSASGTNMVRNALPQVRVVPEKKKARDAQDKISDRVEQLPTLRQSIRIENVKTAKANYTEGETVVVTYEVVNKAGRRLSVPLNTRYSRPMHIVGTLQAWIEPVDAGAKATDFGRAGRRGNRRAAGGTILPVNRKHLEAGERLYRESPVGHKLKPGRYRYYVELKAIDDASVISEETVEFRLEATAAPAAHETLTLKGHTNNVGSVSFSPDGSQIVSGSKDTTVKVWDAETGQQRLTLNGHFGMIRSVKFSPDSKWIVAGGGEKGNPGEMKVWDAETGQEMLTLKGHTAAVFSVSVSPDGKRIVSAARGGTIKVWDAKTGQETLGFQGHSGNVNSVSFSPDGKWIVSGGTDKTARLWDAETGGEMLALTGHTGSVISVAFSPDGKQIVSGSEDKTVSVWDAATGQQILTLKGHAHGVYSVNFSPDGTRIVSGSRDKNVKLWDAATGHEIQTLNGHTERVSSVCFSADGKRIVSGSHDDTLKVWDARPWTAEQSQKTTLQNPLLEDSFNDASLEPLWRSSSHDGLTVEEADGVAKVYGIVPTFPERYVRADFELVDSIPAESFEAQIEVLAKSDTYGGAEHRSRAFGLFAYGNNGRSVGVQYWAGEYRIQYNNGDGRKGGSAPAIGDEKAEWHLWRIAYDATDKTAAVFIDDRQIGSTVTVDLGDSFTLRVPLSCMPNTRIEGNFDNFRLDVSPHPNRGGIVRPSADGQSTATEQPSEVVTGTNKKLESSPAPQKTSPRATAEVKDASLFEERDGLLYPSNKLLEAAVDMESLALDENETLYTSNRKLFSGWVKKYFRSNRSQIAMLADYRNGVINGKSWTWHENGELESIEHHKNNEPHGSHIMWHDNGQKAHEATYKDGKMDGPATQWHENGQLKMESTYKDGKREDGLQTMWHENGKKDQEVNFKDGKEDGMSTAWHENGQKIAETTFKDGKRDGPANYWYENGQKKQATNYKDGKPVDGLLTIWHENGQKQSEATVKDGELDGLATKWHENGEKQQQCIYKDGKEHGPCTVWHENGKKKSEFTFKAGKPHGPVTVWDENGKLVSSLAPQNTSPTATQDAVDATKESESPPAEPNTPPISQQASIDAIKELGGRVMVVDARGVPAESGDVISVGIDGPKFTDAELVHLQGLKNLKQLHLRSHRLTNAALVHLQGLKNLETLSLNRGGFTDAGLVHLKGLTRLVALYLYGRNFTDAGLTHLQALANLRDLSLGNSFTDTSVENLKELGSLRVLTLNSNKFTDAGLVHLPGLTNLQQLNLGHSSTGFTDAGLAHLQELKSLRVLNFSGKNFTNAGLGHITGLTSLTALGLLGDRFTDEGLEHLKGLTSLRYLALRGTPSSNFTEVGKKELQAALPQCVVDPDPGIHFTTRPTQLPIPQKASIDAIKFLGGRVNLDESGEVESVSLAGNFNEYDMEYLHIRGLTNLRELSIVGIVSDTQMEHLQTLTALKKLTLVGRFTDDGLGHLNELKSLESLVLLSSFVTDAGLEDLKKSLPQCDIRK